MEGRSQHKTQEQGVLELSGEQFSGLNLVESKVPKVEKETSVFDGIDTLIIGTPKFFEFSFHPENSRYFIGMENSAREALNEFELGNPQKIIPAAGGRTRFRAAVKRKTQKRD